MPRIVPILLQIERSGSQAKTPAQAVGLCASWALDNVFPSDNRDFSVDVEGTRGVNVILNPEDSAGEIKLGRNGLVVRSDTLEFASIRATACVTEGVWFYEVTLLSPGIMQIGWATRNCRFNSAEGYGVGDDLNSFAYDGCRRKIWSAEGGLPYSKQTWKAGDVVGALLDLDQGRACFFLNGVDLGPSSGVDSAVLRRLAGDGLFPAISMMTFEHCIFNFGCGGNFCFPPKQPFRGLNEAGQLEEGRKTIVPKLAKPSTVLFPPDEGEDARPTCQICCALPPNTRLIPCGHQGFCFQCTLQCEICPICRRKIENRDVEKEIAEQVTR